MDIVRVSLVTPESDNARSRWHEKLRIASGSASCVGGRWGNRDEYYSLLKNSVDQEYADINFSDDDAVYDEKLEEFDGASHVWLWDIREKTKNICRILNEMGAKYTYNRFILSDTTDHLELSDGLNISIDDDGVSWYCDRDMFDDFLDNRIESVKRISYLANVCDKLESIGFKDNDETNKAKNIRRVWISRRDWMKEDGVDALYTEKLRKII